MESLRTLGETWAARARNFADPAETDIYRRCVEAALEQPAAAQLLNIRPGVGPSDVAYELQGLWHFNLAVSQSSGLRRRYLRKASQGLARTLARHRAAGAETEWHWLAVCLGVAFATLTCLVLAGLQALLLTVLAVAAVFGALALRGVTGPWRNISRSLLAGGHGIVWVIQRVDLGYQAVLWGDDLYVNGVVPMTMQRIRHMLGDDPDSLFIPEGYDGLGTPRASGYVVDTAAARQLKRKLQYLDDGTIAVCGPRGAGKTTLLQQCVDKAGFGFLAQAPATYTPHDFLLTLSVRLCRTYMTHEGYEPPEFTRLSPLARLLRRARRRAREVGRWSTYAVPAAALLVLGLSPTVRSLYTQYAGSLADFARTWAERVVDRVHVIWEGQAVAASVIVAVIGIVWWRSRHTNWLPALAAQVWKRTSGPLGMLLVLLSAVVSVMLDLADVRVHIDLSPLSVRAEEPVKVQPIPPIGLGTIARGTLLLVIWLACRQMRYSRTTFWVGLWHIKPGKMFRLLAPAAGFGLLYFLVTDPQIHALLADPENPLRLAGVLAGTLLMRAGGWTPRKAEPELVTRCRNYLYRLQTTQASTSGMTTGAAQILSLGSTHSTSLSTIPPNYPELVEDFRTLLRLIAEEQAAKAQSVVIAIDEVDRLGSDTQALAFLSEIKAILGVPDVYFLISVAEDVGAAFVRRGLPHRDVTDSSLDDIIHVQPSTLAESRTVLAKRSEALTDPYIMLAHALSGGILRDLLRYGLQLKEMQDKAQSHELAAISRHLILEELSETLAGFRTLLSKQQWTLSTSGVLSAFRALGGHLHDMSPGNAAMLHVALADFADFYATSPVPEDELTDAARQLIDEASTYAYFSLTLLDIFSSEGIGRRTRQAARQGPDGDPERLAEARRELGISPYSARALITDIRKAWSLPLQAAAIRIPPPAR
ncbi:hypothetical protein [Streptomyces xanthophaeus]|uniref:KAP NTPase domain-containing protein n=1 Tax=Streptomyces xanthophaeus TaxID=67385 RepID=A0A919LD54_9ACTN|nr:hypothetical protein [Streptomyces xanthophaeus]GHI90483.1 hypothetical protein Sxan_78470 [Streptomyces xanthophaeus]